VPAFKELPAPNVKVPEVKEMFEFVVVIDFAAARVKTPAPAVASVTPEGAVRLPSMAIALPAVMVDSEIVEDEVIPAAGTVKVPVLLTAKLP